MARGGLSGIAIALALAVIPLLSPSAALAAGDSAYVACTDTPDAAPATFCEAGKPHGLFFQTRGSQVQYKACITSPSGYESCTKEFLAVPGYLSRIGTLGSTVLGIYSVVWLVAGQPVASWSYQVVSEEPPLSTVTAATGFRAKIVAESPEAVFPEGEGNLCSRIYSNAEGAHAVCFAEFRTAEGWNLEGVDAANSDGIILSPLTFARWTRRWIRCALPQAEGTLFSNNNCGYQQPEADATMVSSKVVPNIRFHHPTHSVGWDFTESSGFNGIGVYHGAKRGRNYVFTNAIGDSFKYKP
jgi:hypothetical protein